MNKQPAALTATIAVLLMLGGTGFAARAQAPATPSFERLDVNEDGVLSGIEIRSVAARDADGDGRVTKAEFDGSGGPGAAGSAAEDARLFAERDITEDGFLSGKEVKGFESLDADGDGEVTKDEFLRGRAAARRSAPSPAPAPGEGESDATGGIEAARKRAEALFLGMDANEDGRLSGTEFVTEVKEYDTDGDGRVTKAEFVAFETSQPATLGKASAAAFAVLVGAIRSGDVRPFCGVMREELRREVDEQVLRWVVAELRAEYGEAGKMNKMTTKESTIAGRPAHEMIAEISWAKGTDAGEISVKTVGGLVIGFRIDAPFFDRIDEALYARLTSDRALAGEVGEHFADRGREFLDLVFAEKNDEAYGRFHANVQSQLPLDTVKKYFDEFRSQAGKVREVEYTGITCKVGTDGKPENRFSLDYDIVAENGKFQSQVRFQFVGFQGALVGIYFEKADE